MVNRYFIPLLGTLLLSTNISAQTEWVKYEGNAILTPGGMGQSESLFIGTVLQVADQYKMWYGGSDFSNASYVQTFLAYSDDGVSWIKYDGGPVLALGEYGAWDDHSAMMPTVLYHDGIYKMWYVARKNSPVNGQVGYAESTDGINWQKYEYNPVMTYGDSGSFDEEGILAPSVIFHEGLYYMWYVGIDTMDEHTIGLAYSSDGITWNRHDNNPVIYRGGPGEFDYNTIKICRVIRHDGIFQMWYHGNDGYIRSTGYASSEDGINWAKWENNPVFVPDQSSWEANMTAPVTIIPSDDNALKMWYLGGPFGAYSIGYATSGVLEPVGRRMVIPNRRWVAGDTVHVPIILEHAGGVAGIDFTVAYDTTLLSYAGIDTTELTGNFLLVENSTVPGTLVVSMASAVPLPDDGGGALALMSYIIEPDAAVGDSGAIEFQNAGLADVDGSPIDVHTEGGFVIVTMPGDVNFDGHLSSGDAVITLRIAIGDYEPTPAEFKMADRDSNDVVEEPDALCILRLAVGLDCLIESGSSGLIVQAYNPYVSGVQGQILEIPIYLSNASELAAGSFFIRMPEPPFHVLDVVKGELLSEGILAWHRDGNNLKIGFVQPEGSVQPEGEVVRIGLLLDSNVGGEHIPIVTGNLFDERGRTMGIEIITGITEDDDFQLESFALSQNHPNPFNPSTRINYRIPVSSWVKLSVYNMLGEEVTVLIDEEKQPGDYSVMWNAADRASGIYFYRLQAGDFIRIKKMMVIK